MNLLVALFLFVQEPETIRLNLEKAREMALRNNPEIALYREEEGSARDRFFRSISSYLPQPVLSATYSDRDYTSFGESWASMSKGYSIGFQVEQTIFSADKITSFVNAGLGLKGARENFESRKREFLLRVDGAYLDLLLADKVLEARRKALERALKNEELIRQKFTLGAADSLDLLNALVSSEQARLELERAIGQRKISERELLTLLGLRRKYVLELEDLPQYDFPEEVPEPESLEVMCIRERPDLLALRRNCTSSRVSFSSSLLSFLPDVKFGWYWNYYDEKLPHGAGGFFDEAERSSGYYASLYFSLLDYPFNLKSSRREMRRASLSYRERLLSALSEVEKARIDYLNSLKEYKLAILLKEKAERAMELARAQYEAGGISTIELFDAESRYNEALENFMSSYYRLFLAREKLNYAVGKEVVR